MATHFYKKIKFALIYPACLTWIILSLSCDSPDHQQKQTNQSITVFYAQKPNTPILLDAKTNTPPLKPGDFIQIKIADKIFKLELASDEPSRYRGLSFRDTIPQDSGMIFTYTTPAVRHFAMRDCLLPIDLIFLNQFNKIVRLHPNMPVQTIGLSDQQLVLYSSLYPMIIAIELKAGTIHTLGLKQGQTLHLPLDKLKHFAH